MSDMTKQETRTMAVLLVGMVDGLLEVCKKHDIEIGTISYEQNGESTGEYSVHELIAMCRHKLNVSGEAHAISTDDENAN